MNKFEITENKILDELLERINNGESVNIQDKYNKNSALTLASYDKKIEVLKELLKFPNIDINIQDGYGNTALMFSSLNNYLEITQNLLKYPNINVNIQNNYGNSALIWSSRKGNIKIVKELLRYSDINIELKTKHNKTALNYAIEKNYYEITSLLKTYSYIQENKERFTQLGIDNSIVETVVSEDNSFEINKQNIDSLIQQYSINGFVSVVEIEDL